MKAGRTLLAITVYNGRAFTPRALASAARLASSLCDVVVLDDCSPEPGWGDELAALCATLKIGCYRSPRNLGIPRNFNLALLLCEDGGYSEVIIANSDVIFPANLVHAMSAVARTSEMAPIASVTAWSNNASIYSIPNEDPHRFLADEPTVDWVSQQLADRFGAAAVPIPVGMGFCFLVRREAIDTIGLFDPVFGRGYCEEVDWCRRAVDRGWINLLAPSCFVYHVGSASTREAGLLRPGEQTIHTNEDIVDRRHPDYREAIIEWEAESGFAELLEDAKRALVRAAARQRGYVLEATWLPRANGPGPDPGAVRIEVSPDGPPLATAVVEGFRVTMDYGLAGSGILQSVGEFVGMPAAEVRIHAPGSVADALRTDAARAGVPLRELARYPERV